MWNAGGSIRQFKNYKSTGSIGSEINAIEHGKASKGDGVVQSKPNSIKIFWLVLLLLL